MANNLLKPLKGCVEAGVVKLYGKVVTSTSGTISSTSCKGFTIAKTDGETGRYTVTLNAKYQALLGCSVAIVGATDAAYTTAKGLTWILRNVDVDGSATANGSFDIQFNDPDGSPADAELANAAEFYLEITLKDSTAY